MLEIVRGLTTKVATVLSMPPTPEPDVRRLSLRAFVMELAKLDPKISAVFSKHGGIHNCPESKIRCSLRYDLHLTRGQCRTLLLRLEKRFAIEYTEHDYRALRRTGFRTTLLYSRSKQAARRADTI